MGLEGMGVQLRQRMGTQLRLGGLELGMQLVQHLDAAIETIVEFHRYISSKCMRLQLPRRRHIKALRQ